MSSQINKAVLTAENDIFCYNLLLSNIDIFDLFDIDA